MSAATPRLAAARRLAPLMLVGLATAVFAIAGLHRYVTLAVLAENRAWLCALVERQACLCSVAFIVVYAGLTALSVPGAAILTMAGGFLFGTRLGLVYAVVGGTVGATVVFLAARAGLGGLATRAGPRARWLEEGFRRNAFNYLLVVRLIPVFPFWLVNLAAGLTEMKLASYVLATLLGVIPGAFVFASLGSGLGNAAGAGAGAGPAILLQPGILLPLIGLAVLALLPVLYRRWRCGARKDPM